MRGRRRGGDVAAVAALAAALLFVGWILRSPDAPTSPGDRAVPAARELAESTERIRSTVAADGTIAVTHRLHTDRLIGSLRIRVPVEPAGETVQVSGLEVTAGGEAVAVDGGAERGALVSLERPSGDLVVSYELTGALVASDSVAGRRLAEVTFAEVEVDSPPRTRVVAVDGGRVRSLACAAEAADVTPRPCGRPAGDGWRVRLTGDAVSSVVSAQVDLAATSPSR